MLFLLLNRIHGVSKILGDLHSIPKSLNTDFTHLVTHPAVVGLNGPRPCGSGHDKSRVTLVVSVLRNWGGRWWPMAERWHLGWAAIVLLVDTVDGGMWRRVEEGVNRVGGVGHGQATARMWGMSNRGCWLEAAD